VKIFRPEALDHWERATKLMPNIPKGFSFTVEFEGVDGNSGMKGSGRGRSIDVQDGILFLVATEHFTKLHLKVNFSVEHVGKWDRFTSRYKTISCGVCNQIIDLNKTVSTLSSTVLDTRFIRFRSCLKRPYVHHAAVNLSLTSLV
jgi:hypothetical protein